MESTIEKSNISLEQRAEMEKQVEQVFENAYNEFGLVFNDLCMKDIKASVWKDQDGTANLIFYNAEQGKSFTTGKLYYFYNTIFGAGEICRVRSDLYRKKDSFNDDDAINGMKINIITLASIAYAICGLKDEFLDLDAMSRILGWLYGERA